MASKRTYMRFSPNHVWHIAEAWKGNCVQRTTLSYLRSRKSGCEYTEREDKAPAGKICKRCDHVSHFEQESE